MAIFDDIVTLLLRNDAEQSPKASEELLFKWQLPVDMIESRLLETAQVVFNLELFIR